MRQIETVCTYQQSCLAMIFTRGLVKGNKYCAANVSCLKRKLKHCFRRCPDGGTALSGRLKFSILGYSCTVCKAYLNLSNSIRNSKLSKYYRRLEAFKFGWPNVLEFRSRSYSLRILTRTFIDSNSSSWAFPIIYYI